MNKLEEHNHQDETTKEIVLKICLVRLKVFDKVRTFKILTHPFSHHQKNNFKFKFNQKIVKVKHDYAWKIAIIQTISIKLFVCVAVKSFILVLNKIKT